MKELFGEGLRVNVPLARYTSARIGGAADYLVTSSSAEALAEAAQKLWSAECQFMVVGGGSNILVADRGYRGAVVLNRSRSVAMSLEKGEGRVQAESGANLGAVARQCVERDFLGLEWAATVPGTIGGAVVGNAGAHGGDMAGSLDMAEILHRSGQRRWVPASELGYGYRTSRLKGQPGDWVVLRAQFRLQTGSRDEGQTRVENFVRHRKRTQPPGASIGSMFKNPPGDFAGRLIEAAGLKGARIGNAEISRVHANFFVNQGDAKASDVLRLIRRAQQAVLDKFGVELDLEVELVGEWGSEASYAEWRRR